MIKWATSLLLLTAIACAGCAGRAAERDTLAQTDSSVPACTAAPTQARHEPGKVAVFFTCASDSLPSAPRALLRQAPPEDAALETALKELLKGPNAEEQAAGFRSFFSGLTAGMLKRVTVTDEKRAIVDFADFRDKMSNASTSAGAGQLIRELSKTVFQFDEIQEVEYQLDGSCDAFFQWLQSECHTISASEYR
ncbi:MAG TPA: GerMN domain-containing protein [Symbiobacteriaceae bacterium]|nr:GerMN domain-containing protein [Symbiobacteriaceae bacterium]